MASQNDILKKLFEQDPNDEIRKKMLDHKDPDKKERLLKVLGLLAETEDEHRTNKISDEGRDEVYVGARDHIKKNIVVTGYLDSSKVDEHEAKNPDRKG